MAKNTEEQKAAEAPALMTLEDYVKEVKPNRGTVASFKYENPNALAPRTKEDWDAALLAQANRVYL